MRRALLLAVAACGDAELPRECRQANPETVPVSGWVYDIDNACVPNDKTELRLDPAWWGEWFDNGRCNDNGCMDSPSVVKLTDGTCVLFSSTCVEPIPTDDPAVAGICPGWGWRGDALPEDDPCCVATAVEFAFCE